MNIQYTQENMEDNIKNFVNSINSQQKFISMLKPAFGNCNIETKELTLKFHVDEWMLNPQNALHGGITTAIFDTTFGLADTVEKSAEILVKVLSMTDKKRQSITDKELLSLEKDFKVKLNRKFVSEE